MSRLHYFIKDGSGSELNTCYVEYSYAIHSPPMFIMLICSNSVISMFTSRVENSVDPDQLASFVFLGG